MNNPTTAKAASSVSGRDSNIDPACVYLECFFGPGAPNTREGGYALNIHLSIGELSAETSCQVAESADVFALFLEGVQGLVNQILAEQRLVLPAVMAINRTTRDIARLGSLPEPEPVTLHRFEITWSLGEPTTGEHSLPFAAFVAATRQMLIQSLPRL